MIRIQARDVSLCSELPGWCHWTQLSTAYQHYGLLRVGAETFFSLWHFWGSVWCKAAGVCAFIKGTLQCSLQTALTWWGSDHRPKRVNHAASVQAKVFQEAKKQPSKAGSDTWLDGSRCTLLGVSAYQGSGTEVWLTHHGRQFKSHSLCICNKLWSFFSWLMFCSA